MISNPRMMNIWPLSSVVCMSSYDQEARGLIPTHTLFGIWHLFICCFCFEEASVNKSFHVIVEDVRGEHHGISDRFWIIALIETMLNLMFATVTLWALQEFLNQSFASITSIVTSFKLLSGFQSTLQQ